MDVGLVLLRTMMPELALKPGTVLGARVIGRDAIALAGVRIAANLPPELEDGARVQVRVREATGARLVLEVVERASAESSAPAAAAAPVLIPTGALIGLPGGAHARLFVDGEDEGEAASGPAGARVSTVTLRYESAGLGRVDLALTVEPGAVRAVVHGPAGEVAERLRAGTGALREALMATLGRPASVDVYARAEAVDVEA